LISYLYCSGDSRRVVFLFVRRRNFTEYTTVKLLNWTRMFHLLSCFPLRRKCAVHQGSRTRFHRRKTTSLCQFKPLKWVSCWYFAQLKELHVSRNLSEFKWWVLPPNWVKLKNRGVFLWSWNENVGAKQKPQTNGNRAIWLVSLSVRDLFYQPVDEKVKTWTLRFPAKENPSMEKALFDWPIVLQYDVKAKYRLISRKFFGHEVFSSGRSLNQPKATRVWIRPINQSNRSISVRLLFLFCPRVFISRSYENRCNRYRPETAT